MHIEHLVSMANDIAAFFVKAADQGEAARSVATHLHRYWDPRMRKKIVEHQQSGGAGLSDLAREGVSILAQEQAAQR
jgi:formate dehydrogenase subunit delta